MSTNMQAVHFYKAVALLKSLGARKAIAYLKDRGYHPAQIRIALKG